MTRRFWTLAALAVATFAVFAAAIWYLAWRPLRFVDPARGFSIRFSPEWEVIGEGEGAVVRAVRTLGVAQSGGTGVISVQVYHIENLRDAKTYRDWYHKGINNKSFKELARVSDGIRSAGGLEAPWLLFVYRTEPQNIRMQVWQVFFVRGSRGYVLSCTALPFEFENFRPDFEEAVDSFKLD